MSSLFADDGPASREPERAVAKKEPDFVSPRDDLECQLTHIWEELFDRRSIGVTEGFFELGGDSLLAMDLAVRVQKQFQQTLPLDILFRGGTIEHLARFLREQKDPASWSPVVAIQPQGCHRPFFCVHPMLGSVLCYVPLARHLGREQPFYGLQAPGVDGIRPPLTTIEDMAAAHVRALRAVQEHGPYFLGGWSFGGIVAFEMACQLARDHQQVGLLVLVDTGVLYCLARVMAMMSDRSRFSLGEFRRLSRAEQVAYFSRRVAPVGMLPEGIAPSQMQHFLEVCMANTAALYEYRPQIYPGRVTLIRPTEPSLGISREPQAEWRQWATGGVEVSTVPGDHFSMVREPHVQALAQRLQAIFKQAGIQQGPQETSQAA